MRSQVRFLLAPPSPCNKGASPKGGSREVHPSSPLCHDHRQHCGHRFAYSWQNRRYSPTGRVARGHPFAITLVTTQSSSPESSSNPVNPIGVVGTGVVGSRIAINLASLGSKAQLTTLKSATQLFGCKVVVLAQGGNHAALASTFIDQGVSVVSVSDNLTDVLAIIDLHEEAVAKGVTVIAGAGCSPGLSGLLVSHVTRAFASIDEVHTAVHGTGGPMCARQHHGSLGGISIGWHHGEWLQRPSGSGRELCWFPDPIGARDCYRFASPDPLLLQRMNESLQRISSRVSATRRDRLTGRFPMMFPPHTEGGLGGLRVEVRGERDGRRHVEIVGVAERVATVAAAVAASSAVALNTSPIASGVFNLGQTQLPNADILDNTIACGVILHQFIGK